MKRDVWAGHDFDAMAASGIVWVIAGFVGLVVVHFGRICSWFY